jgi:bifunctional DNA-binding transcriptional regulator/antitoxin component of YhaV-PrlF toxin-antitoxin module
VYADTRFLYGKERVNDMSEGTTEFVAESKVSGNQANIPAYVRRELGIEDGDRLRWRFSTDGELVVEAVQRHEGTFSDFEGYEGGPGGDVVDEHDAFGLAAETDEERDA